MAKRKKKLAQREQDKSEGVHEGLLEGLFPACS